MKRVIVIGAGPAGLTAACELLRQSGGYAVTVVEQSDQVGGISRTVRHGGNRMDIGGHRFFSRDARVCRWWAEQMPDQGAPACDDKLLGREVPLASNGPDPDCEDRVMLRRRRVSRIFYRHSFFDYPISMKLRTICAMGLFTTLRAGCSYLRAAAFPRKETSLEDFYINRFGKVLYSMFFEGYTEKLWGRHPRDIAADWGAQRVRGLSVRALLADLLRKTLRGKSSDSAETSLIESFRYPKFGPGQLWEAAADEITSRGGTLLTGARAEHFAVQSGSICGVRISQNGESRTLPCDLVFSSMPLKDLVAGLDSVPPEIARIAQGLPYRDFVTLGLLVDSLALKNETKLKTLHQLIPDCWIYVQDPGVQLGRIQVFNNWSPYLVEHPAETVWLGLEFFCTEGDAFWNLSERDCAELGAAELRKLGVLSPDAQILDFHREQVRKAYPAYFDTYGQLPRLRAYLDGLKNLYCIGRNGQHRYNNMDHSMETAFAAVSAASSGSLDKSSIWNVNAEMEYHEKA